MALQELCDDAGLQKGVETVKKSSEYLATSRPTAVNLFWALNRIQRCGEEFVEKNPDADLNSFKKEILNCANMIFTEDVEMCKAIGVNGEKFIEHNSTVLTHCNAGALATAGQGTALSPMYEAYGNSKVFKVYVDETRPLLQGARLTAWELTQAGINATLICDNMAASLMKAGKIDAIITGADRIAANGDAANKIGTYGLSVLAKVHNVPFYIAAPSSTFDLSLASGDEIPIEQRGAAEVANFAGQETAPKDIDVYNPAFDVTCAENITAIITEKGVIESPSAEKIAVQLK